MNDMMFSKLEKIWKEMVVERVKVLRDFLMGVGKAK